MEVLAGYKQGKLDRRDKRDKRDQHRLLYTGYSTVCKWMMQKYNILIGDGKLEMQC